MSDFDVAAAARKEMLALGLVEQWGTRPVNGHHLNHLDLNLGQILVSDANLLAVVGVFSKHSRSNGEHVAMCQLVCLKSHMADAKRFWERPYYTDVNERPDDWVRMSDFLTGA